MSACSDDVNQVCRERMVREQIVARGVSDSRVLAVMTELPRERFVRSEDIANAFGDRALPIDCGQTISQPYVVAAMTAALQLKPEYRVLELGTGSGYQTAILARLVREVYTIERVSDLSGRARSRLESLGLANVFYRVGDGSVGWAEAAPFEGIMVTAGAPEVPAVLVDQLADGGRLVIPVGDEREQTLIVIHRQGRRIVETPCFPCRFVRLIGDNAWPA